MTSSNATRCWCGSQHFVPFSDDYLQCRNCNTLVSKSGLTSEELEVGTDESAFYGKEYWLSGMAEEGKGFPDIFARARGELIERNLYWCRTILSLKRPPARILELGCSHGGLLALLTDAGYDATGVELSPWVCEFAKSTFGVPVLCGPVEKHGLADGTYDVIVLMDVLEHLPDPVKTMQECRRLLKSDGFVLIQTPRHVPGRSFAQLQKDEHLFLRMLLPKEHVYLFTEDSAQKLFSQLGLRNLQFFPPIFSDYDMYFAASRVNLAVGSESDVANALLKGRAERMVLALVDLDHKRAAMEETLKELTAALRESEKDRAVRLENINELTAALQESEKDGAARLEQIHTLTRWLLEEREKAKLAPIGNAVPRVVVEEEREKAKLAPIGNAVPRVVVDLTPLLPGGENGGAKPMTLELIRRMALRSPETKFTLLTLRRTFDELGAFNQPNVEVVILEEAITLDPYAVRLVRFIARPASERIRRRLERRTKMLWSKLRPLIPDPGSLVSRLGGSVLFCPFTAPFFAQPGIPTVSVIYDLQYADYPQYFEEQDRAQRQQNFTEACRRADRLVCISDFVRRRVLEESGLPQERVTTVHIQLAHRLPAPAPEVSASVLARLQLTPGRYFLYPANFWKHKNHEMLFVAMGLFSTRFRHSDLKLVCTGAPGERRDFLQSAAERMGLSDKVVLPGYLNESDFSALMHGCLALIYPSLYEGFGMPVIEAQAIGKPVLCGNLASLPEVAGEAALIFDPRLPESIVAAMQRIESDLTVRQDLIRNGFENVKRFVDADAMATQYLRTLGEVVQGASSSHCKVRHG